MHHATQRQLKLTKQIAHAALWILKRINICLNYLYCLPIGRMWDCKQWMIFELLGGRTFFTAYACQLTSPCLLIWIIILNFYSENYSIFTWKTIKSLQERYWGNLSTRYILWLWHRVLRKLLVLSVQDLKNTRKSFTGSLNVCVYIHTYYFPSIRTILLWRVDRAVEQLLK